MLQSESNTGKNFNALRLSFSNRIPIVSFYAATRGWPFIMSWCHRISGFLLVIYVWFHLYTLSSLASPTLYNATMKSYGFFLFRFLEWALAVPVIFHALNGGRLILYENFGTRNDDLILRWALALAFLYVMLLGALMLMGGQNVSAVFFWLFMLTASLIPAYGVSSKIWAIPHSLFWKFQRISGAYLFVLVPAHMLFMHLNHPMAHDANTVIMRMQSYFIKGLDMSLAVAILYHAGYGVATVVGDYVESLILKKSLTALAFLVMTLFAFVGIKLILLI
jgi:succinate dehydrogenase hydrophobic anchor subunit